MEDALKDIKTVVFDLDGTLYDKRGLARRLVRRLWWCLPLLAAERLARKNMHYVRYDSEAEFFDAFFGYMSRGHWWGKQIAATWYHGVYMPAMVRLIRRYHHPRPEALQLMEEAKARGLQMAIYSDYGCVMEKLEALGIDPAPFDLIVSAHTFGALKPSKSGTQRLLEMLGADPRTTLFVGDRADKDGECAKNVGAKFLIAGAHFAKAGEREMREKMNKRYQDLKVAEGTYVPPLAMDYPEDNPYEGLYKPVYDRAFPEVDAEYPYFDTGWKMRLKLFYGYDVILRILGWVLRIKYGLRWKIDGEKKWHRSSCPVRRWLKRFDLSRGAITVSNHCYRHDCASVLTTFHANTHTRIPMFAPNFRTKDQLYLCIVGGVPLPAPEAGLSAMKAFNTAFDKYHELGYWFHIFPEAKRWDWYKPLRPFQKGAFTMSYKYNKPIIPFAVSYRERKGIWRLLGPKNEPLTEVIIGEPIFPDTTQPRAVEVERLLNETHATICRLAGIEHNSWPSSL